MPLIIHELPKREDKVITMGKKDEPVADYYPPGATEPQVRPDNVPAPEPAAKEPEASPELEAELEEEVAAEEEAPDHKGKLPDDFPGYAALQRAGLTTYTKVRKELSADKPFGEVDGIGPATAEKIREAMNVAPEEELE